MTIYYVDYKNGSDGAAGTSGAPWKTPAKALAVVTAGDTVRFRGSKTDTTTFYRTAWNASVAGVTWENDTGHSPTWHGGFYTGVDNFGLTGTEPGDTYASMIKIAAHNVTLRGLRVQHVGGTGFTISTTAAGVGVQNALITYCESAYTYGAALVVKTDSKNILIEDAEISYCTFMGMGLGKFDPDKEQGDRGADAVQGSIQLLHCQDTHFHHNLCAYGHGEGINVGRGSTRSIVEYNTVHTMDHIHIAIVRATDCDVRYNVVYHTKHPWYMGGKSGPGALPGGIRIGDEAGKRMLDYPHSAKQRIYGNIVIGCSTCFSVENGKNFDTQMNQAYVGYNTFIGEEAIPALQMAATQWALDIQDRATGADHTNSLIENNIFYAPAGGGLAKVQGAGGVTFRNNAWYSAGGATVPTAARSSSDVTADPKLTAPLTRFSDVFPNPAVAATGFRIDNYRLRDGSPLIGAASNRVAANGVTPPAITADLTGAARTDLDRAGMRLFDIGALEYGGVVADSVTAGFSGAPRSGNAPLSVVFSDESLTTGAAAVNGRLWSFGDGGTSTARNPSYTYAAAGTYTVSLTVYDTARSLSDVETKTGYITVTAAGAVTADFSQNSTGGQAPTAVLFTDASTVAGDAVINRRVWEFGDGISIENVTSIPYIYSSPGTYTPRLTVYDTTRNLSSSKTGATITITAAPPGGAAGVVDVVRQLLPGSAGQRTIAFNLRGHAPALVVLFFTRAAILNTAADDAFVSVGVVTAGEQWAAAFNSNDGAAPSKTEKYFTTTACLAALDGGALEGLAARSSLGPDRLTIEISDAFNGGYLTAVAFAGSQWQARAAEVYLGAQNTAAALNPGFTPEWWLFGGTLARLLAAVEPNADFILGMADATAQVGYTWRDVHGQATTKLRSDILFDGAFRHPAGVGYARLNQAAATLSAYGSDFSARGGWAALDIAGNTPVKTAQFESPTTPGVVAYEVGFAPTALLGVVSNHYQAASPTAIGDTPESFTILAADVGATYSVCVASENGAAATNSKTMAADGVRLIAPDGSTILEGAPAFTDTGFEINWTTVPAWRCYFNVTAFGATPSIVGPIPQFEADDTTPDNGIVQFYDLSNPNGSAITAWSWSFGDGGGSNEQHPQHAYQEPGVYHVALTVVNANGSESILKTSYIHYTVRGHWLLGPYEPRPVTRTSVNRLYGDDPEHIYYGFMETAADFDGLELDAQPDPEATAEPARPGKALLKLDWGGRKIVIVWPDGSESEFSED